MAAPWTSDAVRIQVALTENGTYYDVGYTRTFDMTEGSEGDVTLRWFGGDTVLPGDATLAGSLSVWWDRADTNGQEILRAAKRNGTSVWLRFCPEGTEVGKKCDQFQATISEVSASADIEGEAVEGAFSYTGVPSTLDEVTLAY